MVTDGSLWKREPRFSPARIASWNDERDVTRPSDGGTRFAVFSSRFFFRFPFSGAFIWRNPNRNSQDTRTFGFDKRIDLSGSCAPKHPPSLRLPPCYRLSAARPGARAPQWRSGRPSPSAGGGGRRSRPGGGSRSGKTTPPWDGVELRPGPPGPRTLRRSASGGGGGLGSCGCGCCGRRGWRFPFSFPMSLLAGRSGFCGAAEGEQSSYGC